MAHDSQRPDEPRRDPEVARFSRPGGGGPLRITVEVPPVVDAVLRKGKKDVAAEINRVIAALFRKLTPQRAPSPYGGEVYYFERLLDTPTECLTPAEQHFVLLHQAQQRHEELLERARREGASAAVIRELEHISRLLGELVGEALEVIREDRGRGTPQFEWEVTEP